MPERNLTGVITGLAPVIPVSMARLCPLNRDGRDKPGHDNR
jgi:hypothetical protein